MAKRKTVPPQLRQHAFKAGSAKATVAGAKGGRKSPGTGKTASATTGSAMPPKPAAKKATKPKTAKAKPKRTKRS
jgi:hypothetical protein